MRTKKSKQNQRLDDLVREGIALLICNITLKAKTTDELVERERLVLQIERLIAVYRRVGD